MIVCNCNNVNDKKIKDILDAEEIKSISDLQTIIAICDGCMCCEEELKKMIETK